MALGDLHKDASAVFDHASFAMGATWFGSDLAAVSAALRETPAKGIVLFLTGSRQRGQDAQFAEWMPDLSGWLMVAPNTHALSARPSYTSPAEQSVYAQVHHLRVAEIEYCLSRLQALPAFADLPLAIVGLSEGAVAAGISSKVEINSTPSNCIAMATRASRSNKSNNLYSFNPFKQ